MRRLLFGLVLLASFVPAAVGAQGQGQGRSGAQGSGRQGGQGQGTGAGQSAGQQGANDKKQEMQQLRDAEKKLQEQIKQHELALKSARQRKDKDAVLKEENEIKHLKEEMQHLQERMRSISKGK
jgi:hypothetical protein